MAYLNMNQVCKLLGRDYAGVRGLVERNRIPAPTQRNGLDVWDEQPIREFEQKLRAKYGDRFMHMQRWPRLEGETFEDRPNRSRSGNMLTPVEHVDQTVHAPLGITKPAPLPVVKPTGDDAFDAYLVLVHCIGKEAAKAVKDFVLASR